MGQNLISFQELYERYATDVYRFAYWLSGNPEDAKDITSETFVRIWTSGTETRSETVKAYLLTIARNLYLHHKRRMKRFSPITEKVEYRGQQPDTSAEDRSELERTMAALQKLPELDRTLILLRAQDELSYKEIATITGLTVSSVKVRIFRARQRLSLQTSHH